MPYYSFYLTKEHLFGRSFDKELFASYSRTTLLLLWIWFDINNTNSNVHNGLKSFLKSKILTFEKKIQLTRQINSDYWVQFLVQKSVKIQIVKSETMYDETYMISTLNNLSNSVLAINWPNWIFLENYQPGTCSFRKSFNNMQFVNCKWWATGWYMVGAAQWLGRGVL